MKDHVDTALAEPKPSRAVDQSWTIQVDSLDAFPDAFLELDQDGRISAWNSRAEFTFGWPRADAIGKRFCELIVSPEQQDVCEKAFRDLLQPKAASSPNRRAEIMGQHRDGHAIPIELSLFLTCRAGTGYLGVFARDMSWHKHAEEGAEKRLHDLINQLGEEYFETDLRGNYVFANTRLGEYYHVQSGAELSGKNFRAFFSPEDIQMLKQGFHEVYLTGERRRQEFSIVLNGRLIYVEHTVSLKRDSSGNPVGFMVLSRDCTERKLAQMELAKAIEAAEAASKAKSEFLANMSHEIRTPLNGVVGTLELARDTEMTPDQRELLDMASASARGLLAVINDILDFSKIEAGKLEFECIEFELREVVAEALRSLAIRAHEKGLELAYDVAREVPRFLLGDPARLKQVLLNLVGNAIKFTQAGEVLVRVDLPEAVSGPNCVRIRFSVSDTGIGIQSEKQGLIFDAFSQADSSTTRRFGGTGLGLAISQRLVNLMGGEIEVESEPGQGSTFRFSAKFQAGTGAAENEVAAAKVQIRGLRVLIVDDNATNRRILERLLASWDMLPLSAGSGREALEIMQRAAASDTPFDMILTDCRMPEMDGFQLVDQIRNSAHLPPVSIMMLTSDDYHSSASRCREMGIGQYLIKPVKQSELLSALCGLLNAQTGPEEIASLKPPRREQVRTPPLKILLAEDNRVNQRLAVRMLEKLGHRVVIAGNGREALARLDEHEFDLAFMDVQMPDMDGLSAAAAIREKERGGLKHLPIVALTAHAMSGDRQFCLAAGMDDYLPKPIDSKQLEQVIARVIAAHPACLPHPLAEVTIPCGVP
ncbi:MAG TPA: response regulator [Bryobacteraceae bacterium]|nr:response regulator [Bryobacteraceae bacterium]